MNRRAGRWTGTRIGRRASRNTLAQPVGSDQRMIPARSDRAHKKPNSVISIVNCSVQVSAVDVFPQQTTTGFSRAVRCDAQPPPLRGTNSGHSANDHWRLPSLVTPFFHPIMNETLIPGQQKKEKQLAKFRESVVFAACGFRARVGFGECYAASEGAP